MTQLSLFAASRLSSFSPGTGTSSIHLYAKRLPLLFLTALFWLQIECYQFAIKPSTAPKSIQDRFVQHQHLILRPQLFAQDSSCSNPFSLSSHYQPHEESANDSLSEQQHKPVQPPLESEPPLEYNELDANVLLDLKTRYTQFLSGVTQATLGQASFSPPSLALAASVATHTSLATAATVRDGKSTTLLGSARNNDDSPSPQPTSVVDAPVLQSDEDNKAILMARLLLLGAAALYGTNFSLVKLLGETDMSIGVSSTVRFGLAALATLPWLIMPVRVERSEETEVMTLLAEEDKAFALAEAKASARAATTAGLEVGFWTSIGYIAQAVGLETTSASKSAFLCSLAVVTVPLLDQFVLGKSLAGRQMLGTFMALAGVALLELGGENLANFHLSNGDIASLIQPLAFGMGFWRMEHAMRANPNQANRSTAAQLLAVFLATAAYTQITDPSGWHPSELLHDLHNPTILLGLFWTGVISTALTVYMETVALKTLSAAETTLIFSTEPLWGTAFAAVVMHEQLGLDAGVGALFILVGCLVSNLGWKGIRDMLFRRTKGSDVSNISLDDNRSFKDTKNAEQTSNHSVLSFHNHVSYLRAGLAASSVGAAISNALNTLNIAAKVMAIELEDIVQDIFPNFIDKH